MEYIVKSRSKSLKKLVELMMPSLIRQLKLEKSRKFVLVEVGKTSDENMGVTIPLPGLDSYIVSIKPGHWKVVGSTLAHEMVHVKQLATGVLKINNGINYWRGKRYTKRTKYMDMPWELDAFAKQEIIFRRAMEE